MPHNSKQREKVKKFINIINIINIINKVKKFINWERAILVSLLGVFIALFLILSPQFPKFLNRSEKAKKMLNDSQSKLLKSEDDLCNDSRLTETEVIEPELIKDEEYLFRENNCVSISEESLNEESLTKPLCTESAEV
jgi:hypothetical protein